MKKLFIYGSLIIAAAGMTSCDDFLDDNRFPLDAQSNSPEYWNNAVNVEGQCNAFYNNYLGYGNSGGYGLFYFKTLTDDQAGGSFTNWTNTNVPASSSSWSAPFKEIRRASYIINNVRKSSLTDADKIKYEAIARLNRAHQYFDLVKKYGDVQWISEVVDPADESVVYAGRTDRDIVMDSVLADLNYACANLPKGSKITWCKDMANAMKSDICLWEGTFCKYRTQADNGKAPNTERANKFLQECVTASQNVMNAGYALNATYGTVYNSTNLTGNSEVIFFKAYKEAVLLHSLIAYTASSTQLNGITKDAFDAYLFTDGKPKATTTLNTSDEAEITFAGVDAEGKPKKADMTIEPLLAVRDARLAIITDPCIYFQGQSWVRSGSNEMTSATGYGVAKFDNVSLPILDRTQTVRNYTNAPIFWLPVVLCNYAEAKAELGTITDDDIEATINKLYARAGLPATTKAGLEGINDPANNMGVSSLLWEVRRCRRCELITDNDFRYWDLIRWHQLDKLDSTKNPNILLGANIKQYTAYVEAYNAAVSAYNAGKAEDEQLEKLEMEVPQIGDYIDATKGLTRVYDKKHYLYPIPTNQLTLNPQLTQNPGW